MHTNPNDAEALELFSNSNLAMRGALFKELDSRALEVGMDGL